MYITAPAAVAFHRNIMVFLSFVFLTVNNSDF